jgi:hypothetical protein
MIKPVAMCVQLGDEMPLVVGYSSYLLQKLDLLREVVTEDRSTIRRCECWRTALSVRPDKILASSVDDKFSGVIDENEGHPRVQRIIHSKFRRCAIKLFDYERRKTHGCFRERCSSVNANNDISLRQRNRAHLRTAASAALKREIL